MNVYIVSHVWTCRPTRTSIFNSQVMELSASVISYSSKVLSFGAGCLVCLVRLVCNSKWKENVPPFCTKFLTSGCGYLCTVYLSAILKKWKIHLLFLLGSRLLGPVCLPVCNAIKIKFISYSSWLLAHSCLPRSVYQAKALSSPSLSAHHVQRRTLHPK